MVIALQMIAALLLAAILAAILTWPLGRRGPGPLSGFVFFFVLLFLITLAGGLWVEPVGPAVAGTLYWLPLILIGLFAALLLAALVPPAVAPVRPAPPGETEAESETAAALSITVSLFFWVLVLILIGAVIAGLIQGGS